MGSYVVDAESRGSFKTRPDSSEITRLLGTSLDGLNGLLSLVPTVQRYGLQCIPNMDIYEAAAVLQ